MTRESAIDRLRERELVWHYTTLDVLQQILESKTFLATEVSYQNDPREPETAEDAVDRALDELESDDDYRSFVREAKSWLADWRRRNGFIFGRLGELVNDARFILCASTDPDNMYAWRTYGAGTRLGCAIGLDPQVALGVVGDPSQSSATSVSPWNEVRYDGQDLHEYSFSLMKCVGEAWNESKAHDLELIRIAQDDGTDPQREHDPNFAFRILLEDFAQARSHISAVAKHASFRDERESRVTVSDVDSGLFFTPGSDGPRPRVRLGTAAGSDAVMASAEQQLPIRAIVLSPSSSRQAVTTVNWLLYANGYPLDPEFEVADEGATACRDSSRVVEVHRSAHPYRDV